ncbi:MAG: ABC transporter permease [Kiritimatiellae bacterium]|nr:ABC transporter permease [Kiritimatiellia bacterium]
MAFPLFLALKYLRPKRSVASVIACVSVLGVMLGIAAVIIVRSVMTGFGDVWQEKILDFKPHISLIPWSGNVVSGENTLAKSLRAIPGVTCVTPEVDTRVMLEYKGRVLAPIIIGVEGDDFPKAYKVGLPFAGTFDLEGDSIILGRHAARQLGVGVGDEVTVYSPKTLASRDEVYLPVKWTVTGIFYCGQYEYDSGYVVASLPNVRDLMGMEKGVFAVHLKTANPLDTKGFAKIVEACEKAAPKLRALTWKEADRELFNALAVEKNMTAILLLLISLVAVFCVMNTLLVLTVQKTPEIGLLKSLGFSKKQIMGVFVVHGMVQCTAGVILGLLASWAVLDNLQGIVEWLGTLGVSVFPESVYGLPEIPHRIVASDVVWAVVFVYAFGALASLVPALVAANKDPVKALNE